MLSFRTGLLIRDRPSRPRHSSARRRLSCDNAKRGLRTALTNAQNGDAIVFDNAITLTTG